MVYLNDRVRLVLQAENTECGLACIVMILSHYGRQESLAELRRRYPVSLAGSGLKTIIAISDALGFTSRAVRCDLDELSKLELPCIIHWDLDHYVVLKKVGRQYLEILDPARGARKLPLGEVSKHFTGVALELTPAANFETKKAIEKVKLSDLWNRMFGLTPILIQVFVLTLVLQAFGLLMPISNQIVIDDVIGRGDRDMLLAVMVGFGIVALIQTSVGLLRNFIQLHVGQKLTIQMSGNLLRHLLRLPTDFFERRHVGDIQSRFGSLGPVQDFLTAGIIGALMDIIMLLPCGIIMTLYSSTLSAIVLIEIICVLIVQMSTFARAKRLADESLTYSARTQSIFLETVRAMRTIKLASRESERHAIWQNAMSDQQNMSFRQAKFNLWGSSGFTLVVAIQGLAMLYFGAREIMTGVMTLGMFLAFQAYAMQFGDRTKSLISQFFTFRMLGLHLERLGDIVHADAEVGIDSVSAMGRPITGDLEFRNIDFRYAPQDPWIIKDGSLRIRAGEKIGLIGPSGGGKSTLLKLLTGLYLPLEGTLLVDGVPLNTYGLRSFRSQIGVVMQDDQLLSGTVADNIAFFDAQIDMQRVETVCELARIHDDIIKMPMGYHSMVGDMGSVFSGGQKQRILLARALYRSPKLLFMDEGTANLDQELEREILANLSSLNITQVMVAHRQAVIDFADRLFFICDKSITEIPGNKKEGQNVPL